MTDAGFTTTRVLYMMASALIALTGLFAAARAADPGFALFGWGMLFFGLSFGFFMLHRGLAAKALN